MAEGEVPNATTALARRSPNALRRAPEFYPEGHAGPELGAVLLGAPVAGALGVGLSLAILGVGALGSLAGGLFAVPISMMLAHNRLSNRGKKQLATARALYLQERARGVVALESVAQSSALPEVRLEAAAQLALHHLERGDVRSAIDALSIHEQDASKLRRRRNWEVGLRGELLRSILAWLSPNSFTESGCASSDAFNERDIDDSGRALLAALRVLERASEPDDGRLANAWRDARGTALPRMYPMLHTIVLAVAAERVHHLLDPLHERLDADDGQLRRTVLRQLFPRMQLLDASGYREASPDEPVALAHNVAVAAPKPVVALAKHSDGVVPSSEAPRAFAATYATLISTAAFIGLGAGSIGLGAVFGLFASIYFGTPIAAIWGSRRTQAKRRAHRIEPLASLTPAPPQAWLTECASGPPGPITRSSGYRRLLPIPEGTMVVYVAVAKAEDALVRLELAEAWQYIEWWFEGFSGRLQNDDAMYGAGSSLIRVATLTGHLAEARRLASALAERSNEWDSPANRTLWGNAARAVRLADALLHGLEANWEIARSRVAWALEAPPVFVSMTDRALYARLVREASSAGVVIDWPLPAPDPSAAEWAESIWPRV